MYYTESANLFPYQLSWKEDSLNELSNGKELKDTGLQTGRL